MMMYQLPIDISARIASVTLATMSPPFHSASRPYGFSTSSADLALVETFGAAGAGAAASGAGVAAGVAGVAWVAGAGCCACALRIGVPTAAAIVTIRTVARMARRVVFTMLSPGSGCCCDQSSGQVPVDADPASGGLGTPPVRVDGSR